MKPELNKLPREYGISDPINPNTTEFTFVIRNVTKRMNGTLHTLRCDTPCCGGNVTPCSIVVNSTMLIVAGKSITINKSAVILLRSCMVLI